MEPKDLQDEDQCEEIAQSLIKEAAARYGYEPQTKLHPTQPILNRYWYRHSLGRKETSGSSKDTVIADQNENAIDAKSFSKAFDEAKKQVDKAKALEKAEKEKEKAMKKAAAPAKEKKGKK